MVPAGVAAAMNSKRLCASRGEAAYILLHLTGGPQLGGRGHHGEG